jgi:hypothetical protein
VGFQTSGARSSKSSPPTRPLALPRLSSHPSKRLTLSLVAKLSFERVGGSGCGATVSISASVTVELSSA